MGAPRDDETLLAAARGGDRAALEDLLERWQPRIFRFGLKMCGDPDDASEILQETLLAAARGLRGFRGASSVTTWLYSIARSFCARARRTVQNASASESLDAKAASDLRDPAQDPEEATASREIARALSAGIAELDPTQREILVLRDVEGLTAPQVAEITGLSVEAVKSRLHRARVGLRESLAPLVEGRRPLPARRDDEPASGLPGPPGGLGSPAGSPPCPDIPLLYSRHLEGEVDSDLCARLEHHVSGCNRCKTECDALQATLALCQRARETPLPEPVRTSARLALRSALRN